MEVLRSPLMTTTECRIRKTDDELQIVYGEVYAPNVPDVHGEFMTPVEVRKMAHRFMSKGILEAIDTNHDNELNGSMIVESFIARVDDPIFISESWVIGMHVPDDDMWLKIKDGEINGFSIEALVHLDERIVELEIPEVLKGDTSDVDGHVHKFEVRFDGEGNFVGGKTSLVDGHRHSILRGTVTEETNGHTHRYSIAELMQIVSERAA
jgi:hypothetical protein